MGRWRRENFRTRMYDDLLYETLEVEDSSKKIDNVIAVVIVFVFLAMSTWELSPLVSILLLSIIPLYIGIVRMTDRSGREQVKHDDRLKALKSASLFLKPYDNIYDNLTLSNRYCKVHLENKKILTIENDYGNTGKKRILSFIKSDIYSVDQIWNMLCESYMHNTKYESIVEFADKHKILYHESYTFVDNGSVNKTSKIIEKIKKDIEFIDINNCSQDELTALPGVNIIMAKRAVKKREEIGGFKSVDDFMLYLHIKPHMRERLKKMVIANKMKKSLKIVRTDERQIDL